MGELKKIFAGQRIDKFPRRSFNALVEGELRDRAPQAGPPSPATRGVVREVLIIETIAAATWSDGKLTPVRASAPLWYQHADNDWGYAYDAEIKLAFYNFFTTAITVSEGKGKIALVAGRRLMNVDCNEITL